MIVTCWEWAGTARDEGDFAANWLREVLGKPVRLVRYMGKAGVGDADGDPARRPVDPDFGKGYENTFSDGFPIHLTAEESLVDLNKRLEAPLPMDRFRANIVVAGGEPWAEDEWAGLRIGSLEFSSVKPCGRCKVTTTDQATAEVGVEPLKTLGDFRSGRVLGWNARSAYKRELMFGWNLVTDDRGTLAVGDEVVVTRMRPANELVV
ncbi:hypothetical protein WJX81_005032 [Elliptochloris bilobata]|uniref:MOSC domain-containing protein n=1 Tax=Elliptochloris bilobata TaxID=381761 RepID=A0AAW1QIM7_9CHLO